MGLNCFIVFVTILSTTTSLRTCWFKLINNNRTNLAEQISLFVL